MSQMFEDADAFNGDISTFNTSSVMDMHNMFRHAVSFTGINGLWLWQTRNLQDTSEMFLGAISFQGNGLPSWTISSLLSSRLMVSLECKHGRFFVWYLF
jgi:surface protein